MPDIQIPADTINQFAMFMQRRDAIEQGGIIDGVARPTWDELGEGGQEAYLRDAIAYVGAMVQLGLRPPAPRTFEDRFADAIRRDQETGALPKPTDETPIHTNGSEA